MLNNIKIVYSGLDNAGKTTIIKFLESRQYGLNELKPTQGIERVEIQLSMDTQITQWDMGGQKKFRDEYLQRERDFHDTDLLFFVIDLSDERIDEAIDYLSSILQIIEKVNQNPLIVVLLHKKDLIQEISQLNDLVEKIKDKINSIKKNFQVRFFKTSIYDELSLLNSFSIGLATISRKARELNMELSKMANKVYEAAPNIMILDWNEKGYALMESVSLNNKPYYFIKYSKSSEKIIRKFVLRSILTSSEAVTNIIKNYF